MKEFDCKTCAVCDFKIKPIFWEGGNVLVYDHKRQIDGTWHHFKLEIQVDRIYTYDRKS